MAVKQMWYLLYKSTRNALDQDDFPGKYKSHSRKPQQIKSSLLHQRITSLFWITIRKQLINCRDLDVKSLHATSIVNVKEEVLTEERNVFKEKLSRLEAENYTLKLNLESEISEHEQVIN